MTDAIQFDEWQYVRADSAERARSFFGAEATRPVRFEGFSTDPEKPGRIFAVKAFAGVTPGPVEFNF